MDESKVLEMALQNCQRLERCIYDSIKQVRRLNIRYNSDWLLKNYKNYMNNIWLQYRCQSPPSGERSQQPLQRSIRSLTVVPTEKAARSSLELCGTNRKINYNFIKIKRSMEALMLHIHRAIEIGNRQRNYRHLNVGGRGSKERLCCH